MTLLFPNAVLSQHIIALGKTRSGKSSKMRLLVETLLERDEPVCIIDPKGDWWGIKSSADGKRAGFPVVIFGGEHADVPLSPHAGAAVAELIATGNRPSLIDLGGWMVGERTRFFVDFASTFFKLSRGKRYLVIDEVHNFAPQGRIMDPDAGKMLHWANRLASEGSGKGITLIAASQRPQKVHKDFVTSCETLIACRVIHKLDRDAIKDWIDGCADPAMGRDVLQQLATMERPEAWVWSPEVGFGPKRITFPMFSTYDSFRPQEASTGKLKGWAEVDLEEVRSKLQTVVAEVEASDPKMLRKRIADLEAQLARPRELAIDVKALERARAEGISEALRAYEAQRKSFSAALHRAIDEVDRQFSNEPEVRKELPRHAGARLPTGGTEHRAPPRSVAGNGSGDQLPKAERLILTALAQYPQGRTSTQVAILTRYASTGGGFRNAISALRGKDFIEGSGDRLLATPAGLSALGPFEPLPRGQELVRHWLGQLGKAERAALQVLTQHPGQSFTREELAEQAGYDADGGGFRNALSRLRTLELVTGRGELQASEDLFG